MEERKYRCTQSMRLNVESMETHLILLRYKADRGEDFREMLLGRPVTKENIYKALDFVSDLHSKSYGLVTYKEYGYIKSIEKARQSSRYAANVEAGNEFAEDALHC